MIWLPIIGEIIKPKFVAMGTLFGVIVLCFVTGVSSLTLVDVFVAGEGGYFCIKIPSLVVTHNGTLLATGEARHVNCSDYTWTDLVFKRSFDNGSTW